MTIRAGMFSRS